MVTGPRSFQSLFWGSWFKLDPGQGGSPPEGGCCLWGAPPYGGPRMGVGGKGVGLYPPRLALAYPAPLSKGFCHRTFGGIKILK